MCGLDWASDRVKRTVKICLGQNIGWAQAYLDYLLGPPLISHMVKKQRKEVFLFEKVSSTLYNWVVNGLTSSFLVES